MYAYSWPKTNKIIEVFLAIPQLFHGFISAWHSLNSAQPGSASTFSLAKLRGEKLF
jgi:hypothetical protein